MYLWLKAFHIIFMVTWFAGLFYLPRLFVYHADCHDQVSHDRFLIMERRLYILMTIGGILTALFGLWLLFAYILEFHMHTIWLWAKLGLVAALIAYHFYLGILVKVFRENRNTHSARFYRLVNEAPSILLIAIIILVVVKPA